MTKNMNPQLIAALANLTRLNKGEGLLLALHPDFILAVRPGMNKDERETAADTLLNSAEGFAFLVLEDPVDDEDDEEKDRPVHPPDPAGQGQNFRPDECVFIFQCAGKGR